MAQDVQLVGRVSLGMLFLALVGPVTPRAAEWVRAGVNTNQPVWGPRGGLQFALHPGGFGGRNGGPRGLIRLGYPTLTNGGYDLINFLAIEPIARGRRGFSELERSAFDQQPGKVFRAGQTPDSATTDRPLSPGRLWTDSNAVEHLEVELFTEPFNNGAHVRLTLGQRSDAPNELRLTLHQEADSAPIDACIITATMGNKARARLLWLKDGPVSSHALYPRYRDRGFAPHRVFPLNRLPRTPAGEVVVAFTTDETRPETVHPFGRPHFWDYRGRKVTQYWRVPAADVRDDLQCVVNARFTYWRSRRPIPGGLAFENVELRQPFREGQTFLFGITTAPPAELLHPPAPPRTPR